MADSRNRREDDRSEFIENIIAIDRVARVVKGGRRFRFRALAVVGDGKNKVGIGISKGGDIQVAIQKAISVAKKQMIEVAVEDGSLPHEVQAKHAGSVVLLKPAASGTGIIAGGTVRAVLETIGIENILSKSLGSSNKINTAYATIEALKLVEPRENWVTQKNSKKPNSKKTKTTKAGSNPAKAKVAISNKGDQK